MPADRLLHPKCGHSEKVSKLSDLEYRVWTQYLLSADDFGVMRASPITLQADNDSLSTRPQKSIKRCLETIIGSGLVDVFEHQARIYVFQRDWQTWQKVDYPRATNEPKPSAEAIARCDDATRALFEKHPGGQRKGRENPKDAPSDSERASQINPEGIPTTRASASAERLTLTANANGQWLTRPAPIHDSSHKKHALCGRICLPSALFGEFVRRRNHPDAEAEVDAWAGRVLAEWADKPEEPGDSFDFWKARYAEQWPAKQAVKDTRPAWAQGL